MIGYLLETIDNSQLMKKIQLTNQNYVSNEVINAIVIT